jgi:hypothetical protein
MLRLLLVVLLFASASLADATRSGWPITVQLWDANGTPVVTCRVEDGLISHCKLAHGRTLDDVMTITTRLLKNGDAR